MLPRRAYMARSELPERAPEEGARRWLVAGLDKSTSIIVRRRDRRRVTCGTAQGLQCSHFYSRRHPAIRFDLRNCNAMCSRCNRRHNRDRHPYERYMLKTYGRAVVTELDELRMGLEKVTDERLSDLLQQYKAAV